MVRALLDAIRQACPSSVWSQAVLLARKGGVLGEADDGEEVVLRVTIEGKVACQQVSLFPEDEDWSCDCVSTADACVHVAAAVIALNQARLKGQDLPGAERPHPRVIYAFRRSDRGLAFDRWMQIGEERKPLRGALLGGSQGERGRKGLMVSRTDLAVERLRESRAWGVGAGAAVPPPLMSDLLSALRDVPSLELDGLPVVASSTPVVPQVVLDDHPQGFWLQLHANDEIDEIFPNGAALCGDTLRPIGKTGMSPEMKQELARGRQFPPAEAAYLTDELLPRLRRKLPVVVKARTLPERVKVAPRIVLQTGKEGHELSVLATLVYGDPPLARVDRGELVLLDLTRQPVRNRAAEKLLVDNLSADLDLQVGRRALLADEAAVGLVARLSEWEDSVEGECWRDWRLRPEMQADLRVNEDGVDLSFETSWVDEDGVEHRGAASADRVMGAWKDGAWLVPLDEGGWAPLPTDWLDRLGPRLLEIFRARREQEALPAALRPALLELCDELEQVAPPGLERLRGLFSDFDGLPSRPLPEDLRAELRSYQRVGVDWLGFLAEAGLGGLLADDMGLGKTIQTLCSVRGRTLVVAPTSVLHNWRAEAERFRPGLRCATYHGPDRQLDRRADLTLTTWAILRLDVDLLAAESWGTVVFDEAQAIKNPDSQVAGAARRIHADFRVALTGTPVENRLEEIWSQMQVLNPGLLGGRSDFRDRFARPIEGGDADAAEALRRRLRPFVLRRMKREVARELPPRTDMVLRCELEDRERELYDALRASTRKEVIERLKGGGGVMEALEALLRLRQAACHPALVPGQEAEDSSKVRLLMGHLEKTVAEEHKALVFSQWTSLLDQVEPHLRAAGIAFSRLDGSTRDRGRVVDEFSRQEGPPVLLISLKAGGTGLNLVAADNVVLLDPWWNPAVEEQAADRAHRIGQERPVIVHRIVAKDTVEERILALQEHKRALAAAALDGGAAAGRLSREDLLALLS